jgi:beta-N-acetylhexosaminidase
MLDYASHLTLPEAIGRLLFVGIPGPALDDATRRTLERLSAGGVVLFRRNIGTPAEVAALTAAVHALPSQPLIAIDHEGGRVLRLGEPFTPFPAAARIGATRDPTIAHEVGRAMAQELATVGIDLNFAPVLDVHSNPANPVIGDRSFGSDPALVRDMGIALMRGLLDGDVVPCGKHFPGHGDTEKDSHLELPVVRRSRRELEETELVPFRAAIAAGMPMLMSAHVLYPALDAEHPATLSAKILTDLLRGELGFDGVIASDDLHMQAIGAQRSIGEAAVMTLAAGADVLLVCQELDKAVLVAEAIERALRGGALSSQRVHVAAERVGRLRSSRRGVAGTHCKLPHPAHRTLVDRIVGAA